jgi:hypothetical protein
MDEGVYGLIEMALVFGGVLAFLVWELASLRRSRRGDRAGSEPPDRPR